MKKIKVLDLFAGGGGFSTGFLMSSIKGYEFDIVKALEIDDDACETLENKLGSNKVLKGDITEVKVKEKLFKECAGVDVIIGGPPCQTFSLAGPARSGSHEMREALKNDPRNTLYKHYLEIVARIKPKFVVMENVEGMASKSVESEDLSNGHKQVIELICDELEEMGYHTRLANSFTNRYQVLNSANFGVPQFRKRVIIIANRLGEENPVPIPTHGPSKIPYVTLKDSIGHLPILLPKINISRMDQLKNIDVTVKHLSKSIGYFVQTINLLADNYKDREEILSQDFTNLLNYLNSEYDKLNARKRFKQKGLIDFINGYNELLGNLDKNEKIEPKITLHSSRLHNFRDIVIFCAMKQKSTSAQLMQEGSPFYDGFLDSLYPYSRNKHKDTYVKHCWNSPSNTILAHMQKRRTEIYSSGTASHIYPV
ncbi:DNA cytosine methyltransferase [Bacillus salipaludis]|uniref:Cytosine-specific methyltransferase n=1 Tax=Bacillus salipaludis TaxID=2547811 RepID=A0AA90R5P8_9BACI|nr:DNA cytosine methyltransferase [Bacillus salipaludis]MDQ6598106.1 DNA cytosine methyltransferase [Bacillus salipaludis]